MTVHKATTTSSISFSGAETKVQSASTASGVTAALATLALFLLSQLDGVDDMPVAVSGSLLVVVTAGITGVSTFLAGWYAKHTLRPDITGPPLIPPAVDEAL